MKKLILILTFFPLFAICQSGCHVYGKIKFVDFGEDLKIKYVSYGEKKDGKWKVVDYGEDFKVKEVDYNEGCN